MADLPNTDLIANEVEAVLTEQVEIGVPRQELRYRNTWKLFHNTVTRVIRLPSVCIACRWNAKRFADSIFEIGAGKVQIINS